MLERAVRMSGKAALCLLVITSAGAAMLPNLAVAQEPITVGVIYEARPADQPWSASIADSAKKLAKSNPNIKLLESFKAFDPTVSEPVARQMISEGAKYVDFHSFALNDIAHNLSEEFPDIVMSVASFEPPKQPNLNIITSSYLQVGYSNCWLLAKISKSKKIGTVGAMPIPYATEIVDGCKLGAEAAVPGTEVLAAYSNSFDNQQATREQAQALLDQGADVLFPTSATQDALGGFQLCEQKQIPCAGWASENRRYAPTYGVVSAMIDWSVFLGQMVSKAGKADQKAETYNATFGNGALTPQPFIDSDSKIVPKELQEQYLAMVKDLAGGKIKLPQSKAHPCCE